MPLDQIADEIELAWQTHESRNKRQGPAEIRARLAEAQNWRCCYCFVCMSTDGGRPDSATIEHIIPRSRGGGDEEDNLAVACLECNLVREDNYWPIHAETIVVITANALRMAA